MAHPHYEVLALRYATKQDRIAADNFLFPDVHDAPMPIDYYLWAIIAPGGRAIVVDTGYGEDTAQRRLRPITRLPGDILRDAGIDPAAVRDVVITHMHYDHAGNMGLFPNATFHIQDAEMAYCTGRCMCYQVLRRTMELDHVLGAVRHVYEGRVTFHDGAIEIAPGITLHLIGGHTGGLQVVRVPTARGWVVLAADAAHFWANIRTRNPFPLVVDIARMLEGHAMLERLADGPDHIIPGHDPLVATRFPRLKDHPDIFRVDLAPVA